MSKPDDPNASDRTSVDLAEAAQADAVAKATVFRPLVKENTSHSFFNLIGRVAAHMAQFEHVLDVIICDLMRHKNQCSNEMAVAYLTAQFNGAQSRLDAIKALVQLHGLSADLVKQCTMLENNTHGPQKKRNRIIHDAWFQEMGGREVARFRTMSKDDVKKGEQRLHGFHSVA